MARSTVFSCRPSRSSKPSACAPTSTVTRDVVELDGQRHGHHREREAEGRHRPAHQLGQLRAEPREAGGRRRAVVGGEVALAGADAQARPLHAHVDRPIAPVVRGVGRRVADQVVVAALAGDALEGAAERVASRSAAVPPVSSARVRSISADEPPLLLQLRRRRDAGREQLGAHVQIEPARIEGVDGDVGARRGGGHAASARRPGRRRAASPAGPR